MKKAEINAGGKKIGRVASNAAHLLMGKDGVTFARNKVSDVEVHITNASKAAIGEEKIDSKIYTRFSGYPSGLKKENMRNVIKRKGYGEVIKKAVYGMLPKNKLRNRIMKRLIIKD